MKKQVKKYIKFISLFLVCFLIINPVLAYTGEVVRCGDMTDYGIPVAIATFARNLYGFIKIFVPILIILLGVLDFAKAAIASEVKNMDEYKNKFVRRLIAGISVFFILSIVNFVFKNIATDDSSSIISCISCFTTTESSCKISEIEEDSINYNYSKLDISSKED